MIFILGRVEDVPCNCPPCVASGQPCKRSRYYLQGSFSDEALAVEAAIDETYFVGPLPMNAALPHELIEWHGLYFPLAPQPQNQEADGGGQT